MRRNHAMENLLPTRPKQRRTLKNFRLQSRDLPYAAGNIRKLLERQMLATGIMRRTMRGINLHEFYFCAGSLQFLQTLRILFDFFIGWPLSIDKRKQTLDHDRTFPSDQQD